MDRMHKRTKDFLKDWMPPILMRVLRGLHGISWAGDFDSWADAQKVSSGYNSETILAKVKDSALKVKNGQAAYERDSVLFEEIEYSWPLLAGLMWIAAQSRGELNIIDFGGSLGSTYFQNRKFLQSLSKVRWNIIEQKLFVDTGKRHFEDDVLKFYYDIETCLGKNQPDTILFSSVIQYLEKPYSVLEKVKALNFQFILFDRTPFVDIGRDRLTLQTVPSQICQASYPAWFFDKKKFYAFFENEYEVISSFESSDRANIPSTFEGCVFRKK